MKAEWDVLYADSGRCLECGGGGRYDSDVREAFREARGYVGNRKALIVCKQILSLLSQFILFIRSMQQATHETNC